MTIRTPDGPADARDTIAFALADLSPLEPSSGLLRFESSPLRLAQPVRVFTVPLEEVTSSDFFRTATPVGWRYLVAGDGLLDNGVAAADVTETSGGGTAFASLFHGPVPERLTEASRVAEAEFGARPEPYDVRILELPALYLSALWLVGPNDRHVFIPYLDGTGPEPPPIRVEPDFASRAVAVANERRRQGAGADPAASN
jgi:hypothetical protein